MAEETLGELYYRLGVKYDELNESFVEIERSLQENIQRINKKKSIIDIQTKIELLGLDKATQATEIFEVRQKSLQRQIEAATEKMRLFDRVLTDARDRTGENSLATQKAAENYERARLTVAKLQNQLKRLTQQHQQATQKMTAGDAVKWDKLLNSLGISTRLGENLGVSVKLRELKEAFPAVVPYIDKFVESFRAVPTPIKAATVALTALPVAVKAAENAILDAAKPAIEMGDAFYVASRGAQMTIKDFEQLAMVCKVTGIDLNEVTTVMRRLNMQLVRGSENGTLMQNLKKYGVEVRKANGELKNMLDMSIAIAEGLNRAQAAGRGKDFIAGVLGRGASGDVVTYLEDLAANVEAAKSVIRNGLFDPKRAHDLQGEINKMNAQGEQLGSTFSTALMPVAEELVPHLTKRMGELTKVIEDNAEGIKAIGESVAEVTKTVGDLGTKTTELAIKGVGFLGKTFTADTNAIIEKYGRLPSEIKNVNDLINAEMQKMTAQQRAAIENNPALNQAYKAQMQGFFDNIKKWREENLKSWTDFRKADEAALNAFKDQANAIKEVSEETFKKIKNYSEEIRKLTLDNFFGGDKYGRSLADLSNWYAKEIELVKDSEEAKTKLTQLYNLKRAEIEKKNRDDTQKRLSELTLETENIVFEKTHSAFEKQLRDVEQWKDAQISKAKTAEEVAAIVENAAVKEYKAFSDEVDKMRGKVQTLHEKIFEQEQSRKNIDIYKAQKERAEMLQQGYSPELVNRWYNNELSKIGGNRDRNYLRSPRLKEYKMDVPDFYGQLQAQISEQTKKQLHVPDLRAQINDITKNLNLPDMANAMQPINLLSREIISLSQIAGSIAQNLSSRQQAQPPNIINNNNITPHINISLAGAFVADKHTITELTDSITEEVVDKVKEAVETAANRQNYSYARY